MPYLFSVCVIALAACGGSQTDKKTKLVVWGTTESEGKVGYDSLSAAYERRYPNVEVVRAIPERGQDLQKLLCAYVGGDPPDVILRESRFLGNLAARGIVRSLDDLVERDRDKPGGIDPDDYYQGAWEEMRYRGQTYGIPYGADPCVFAYNRHAFREVGLDPERPPKNWDELKEYAVKLTKWNEDGQLERVGFMPYFRGMDPFAFWVHQLGGSILDSAGTKSGFTSPESIQALKYVKELFDIQGGRRKVAAFAMATTQAENVDAFQLGKIAMGIDDNFIIYRTARYGNKDVLDLGLALVPMPTDSSAQSMYRRGGVWAIPSNAKHVEEAWDFIKFFQSSEGFLAHKRAIAERDMREKGMQYGGAHARRTLNVYHDEFLPPDSALRVEAKKVTKFVDYVWSPATTAVASFIWDRTEDAFADATYGIRPIEEALEIAQVKTDEELSRYYGEKQISSVNWARVSLLLFAVFLVGIGVIWWQSRKQSGSAGAGVNEFWTGMAFLGPWVFGFLIFTLGPLLFSIVISFTEYEVISHARWVGFENYINLFSRDPAFWKSLWNTVYMTLAIPFGMAVGLSIAMLLNSKVKGMAFYRTIYYLPAIVPMVASSILWLWVLHPKLGVFNIMLADWGITPIIVWFVERFNDVTGLFGVAAVDTQFWLWVQSEDWSKPGIIVMGLWGAGASMIIWLAGLKGIPEHLYEAAQLDGAGPWRRFVHVTLPMLSPYIFFNLVTGVIGTFQVFTQAFVMTLGGPAQSTLFYVYYLFNNAFSYFKMGYASAMAWILFLVIFVLTMIQLWLSKRWVHYE